MKVRPNILLILADDVGTADVPGYWGNHIVNMPNLAKLQSQGVTFLDAHSTPLCAPTRYMLLSGNYAHRGTNFNGSWDFYLNENNFQNQQKSLAHVLKTRAGYHTAMFGKWHLGAGLPPPGNIYNTTFPITGSGVNDWTQSILDGPNDIGFDTSYFTMQGIQAQPYSFFRDGILDHNLSELTFWTKGDHIMPNGDVSKILHAGEGSKDWDSTSFNMILVNETISFLDHHASTRPDDPFFAYVALGEVHIPHSPPKYYLDGTPIAGEYETEHLDLLLEMDKVIGSLVSEVEERGLADNTIIIFSSDNGGLNKKYPGAVLRGFKGQIYEGGHRVPLVMRYDGVFPRGETRSTHFVGLNDLYATLAEIVGIGTPSRSAQDSVSFAKYIESEENTHGLREYLGTWSYKDGQIRSEAIRFGDLKLVRDLRKDVNELYDLKTDISEQNNLIHDPKYEQILIQMYEELRRIGPCPNDVDGEWTLVNGKRANRRVTCDWFEKKRNRCRFHIMGELMCNSVCGRFNNLCSAYTPMYHGSPTLAG